MHRAVSETLHSGALIANCRQGRIIVYLYERTKIVTCVLASFGGKCIFYTKKKKKRKHAGKKNGTTFNSQIFQNSFRDSMTNAIKKYWTGLWRLTLPLQCPGELPVSVSCSEQRAFCLLCLNTSRQACVHSVRFKVRPPRIPAVCLLRLTGEWQGVEERHEELRG